MWNLEVVFETSLKRFDSIILLFVLSLVSIMSYIMTHVWEISHRHKYNCPKCNRQSMLYIYCDILLKKSPRSSYQLRLDNTRFKHKGRMTDILKIYLLPSHF